MPRMGRVAFTAFVLAGLAPGAGAAPAVDACKLTAPATVRSDADLKVRVAYTNPGPSEVTVTRGAVELAVLAVEVRDPKKKDARVPTIPPPVPRPSDSDRIVIKPGETFVREYTMNVFSPELPRGTYAIHSRVFACAPHVITKS